MKQDTTTLIFVQLLQIYHFQVFDILVKSGLKNTALIVKINICVFDKCGTIIFAYWVEGVSCLQFNSLVFNWFEFQVLNPFMQMVLTNTKTVQNHRKWCHLWTTSGMCNIISKQKKQFICIKVDPLCWYYKVLRNCLKDFAKHTHATHSGTFSRYTICPHSACFWF